MSSATSIALADADPDLLRFLGPEDRALAGEVLLPIETQGPGEVDIAKLLRSHHAFGALVLDGLLLQSVRLGEHAGLRLLGPSDVLALTAAPGSMLVLEATCRATAPTRLVLLEREFLLAARRHPWLFAGLHVRGGDQMERLLTQTMICQLPRVDDRLLSLLWLLAESWGQVTPSGTVLPIELTHTALGGLIGARRPTVTLALGELTQRGAVVRQAGGWLLLQRTSAPAATPAEAAGEPHLLWPAAGVWSNLQEAPTDGSQLVHDELLRTVADLRVRYAAQNGIMRARLDDLIASRETIAARRRRLRDDEITPPPAPS